MAVSCEASFHSSVVLSGQMMALCACRVGDRGDLFRCAGSWRRKVGIGEKAASEQWRLKGLIPDSLDQANVLQVETGIGFLILSSYKS